MFQMGCGVDPLVILVGTLAQEGAGAGEGGGGSSGMLGTNNSVDGADDRRPGAREGLDERRGDRHDGRAWVGVESSRRILALTQNRPKRHHS